MSTIDERCYGHEPAASELARLRAENARLWKDMKRLDWIDKHVSSGNGRTFMYCLPGALRQAVDAEMAALAAPAQREW